ncbi:transposase [Lentisphaera marina]|uniref:transposase n=1 Tax=Lentisphaera marina TaxID=1111041 RepID=UPI002365C535|nr:transposase [Lentisphaera marina]MDD7983555.1 transposase [Lentisphaera marina]
MRLARLKPVSGTYYHVMNRIAGEKNFYPFDHKEKQMFIDLMNKYLKLYKIELLSYCIMSNHFHLVLYSPGRISTEEIKNRWQDFYGHSKGHYHPEPLWESPKTIEQWGQRLSDVSDFMKVLQQSFTAWYNRTHNRRGHFWADRFKSVILGGGNSLLRCIKYVELNPLRADILDENNNYIYSSYGIYKTSKKHPLEANLLKHLPTALGSKSKKTIRCFHQTIETIICDASTKEFSTRQSIWTHSKIIGSKNFITKLIKKYCQLSPDIKSTSDICFI